VLYKDGLVGEYFVDLLVDELLLVERKTSRHRTTRTECNVTMISKQSTCGLACCSISAGHVWRSNAWSMAREPRRSICVLCVHLLFICAKFFLGR
jgi:hypothetical protein